jgi:cytochrome c oxidase cbb3-type subunit III
MEKKPFVQPYKSFYMHFRYLIKKKILLFTLAFISAIHTIAQTTANTAAETTEKSGFNLLAILLLITAAVLAFVIWGLGQVLFATGKQVLEKNKQAKKNTVALIVFVLCSLQNLFAQADSNKEIVKIVPNYGGLSANTFYMFVAVILVEIFAIFFLTYHIKRMHEALLPEKEESPENASKLSLLWHRLDQKLFTKAIPVEKEADIMLDHDYDGIRELDNSLPPWWKYGFYITIAVAFIYIFNFHVMGNGKNPTEEYNMELVQAQKEKEIFEANNKDKIDEKNVPFADDNGIAFGKTAFETKCWSCHGKLGEGGAGPNLTDNYWLHKGTLNDIYNTLKVGYPEKGMQSWTSDYSPKELSYIASYVKKLKGTNPPNPKAAQGDLFEEAGSPSVPTKDTTKKIKVDSTTGKMAMNN